MLIFFWFYPFNGDIIGLFSYYKHQSRQHDSPIFIRSFVYQFRSGLESTNVTTSIMT